ncbi:pyruvate kinase [Rhodoferax sp.]|uniref:pyruvate kinase n=1 Tax=Rhodoferax sp. TaxID=50421 RepID=UPI002613AFE8|nr:pyruvate kinase [Rhodoferax sp.]MDD2808327.1 pyruvate kinase [Rhodoferax sp.]
MKKANPHTVPMPDVAPKPLEQDLWSHEQCTELMARLQTLRQTLLAREADMHATLASVLPANRPSACNLIHYVGLRSVDVRPLQDQLAKLGLSLLRCTELHVLAHLDKVLGVLHRLLQQPWQDPLAQAPLGQESSQAHLQRNALMLLGNKPLLRDTRIMVTLPTEAADDVALVRELVEAGMDIARINCAHDAPVQWRAMAAHVRKTAKKAGRKVKILMDLGGPKIRTGAIAPGAAVLKLKPAKDEFGHIYSPAQLGMQAMGARQPMPGVAVCVGVWQEWLSRLKVGASIELTDARGAKRHLLVTRCDSTGAVAECLRTTYITPETVLHLQHPKGKKSHTSLVCQIENTPGVLRLSVGDHLLLTRPRTAQPPDSEDCDQDPDTALPQVPCTLAQVLDQVSVGERIWFDGGRLGGVICSMYADAAEVEITYARIGGEKLAADKSINLPDSQLNLPALTDKDITDLDTVAELADMVGLSFVQNPQDIAALCTHLQRLQRNDMGLILKIETLRGFERLPELMLAAMAAPHVGIMLARGDLAVECGFERMTEVQEEILNCAEAAHMPVIWSTQVLEKLAKTGLPSQAEISDAGLGVRAECVMLSKGPFITEAIHTLDHLLQRMAGHPQNVIYPFARAG